MSLVVTVFGNSVVLGQPPVVDHPPPLSPAEALKHFRVAEGLEIRLVAAEPQLAQPLSISFDDRGRMWVLQYLQYPNPNGLKPIEMDHWLRTKYEKLPEPPGVGPQGRDRISIFEDTNGDGLVDTAKDFVSDLNLASGMAVGHGGVFVVQPPYLLFYADKNQDDVPDGVPQVLLKGFGMEDAHAFANSLTWGPDGWLYGCQGSTATADIRGIGFQQGVWRYHPLTQQFELFAEGGGNSWGVEFDQFGNVYSAGNEVELLVHCVQGGYYVKGFGKHGPLHNPHTYGYFQPVLHHGYRGDSLSGGAVLYQGGAFPAQFNNACIAPHCRHSAIRWATVENHGSSIATRHVGDFVTTDDIWFRPVDMHVGPDGALYVADWYDYNISHSSPKNRSQWYQPSRFDGRVWRVAPPSVSPIPSRSFDLSRNTSQELVSLLSHPNDWYARQARRILAERRDPTIVPTLADLALKSADQELALQGLWALYVTGGLRPELAEQLFGSPHPYVRAWTVRLLGDRKQVTADQLKGMKVLARMDSSVIVRSQLACTAKRLPGDDALAIVRELLRHDEDAVDVHVPLLIWWAIEDKAISHTDAIIKMLRNSEVWKYRLVRETMAERIARRFCSEGTEKTYEACSILLELAQEKELKQKIFSGMLQALAGQRVATSNPHLLQAIEQSLSDDPSNVLAIELGLRLSIPAAVDKATNLLTQHADAQAVITVARAFGETRTTAAMPILLDLLASSQQDSVQSAVIDALANFDQPEITSALVGRYPNLGNTAKSRAIEALSSRKSSVSTLLDAVETKTIPSSAVSLDHVRRFREMNDPRVEELTIKHWGKVQAATPLLMRGRIAAIQQMLGRRTGDSRHGQQHFKTLCANCHKLHGQGESIGPDLTGAERKNRDLLVANIVDPSSVVREQYISHIVSTTDGRVLTGLLADAKADTVTLLDSKNQRTILQRVDIDELKESPISLMPENLLDNLSDQQIRDLFAYLQAEPAN